MVLSFKSYQAFRVSRSQCAYTFAWRFTSVSAEGSFLFNNSWFVPSSAVLSELSSSTVVVMLRINISLLLMFVVRQLLLLCSTQNWRAFSVIRFTIKKREDICAGNFMQNKLVSRLLHLFGKTASELLNRFFHRLKLCFARTQMLFQTDQCCVCWHLKK